MSVHEQGSTEPLGLSQDEPRYQVGLFPSFFLKDLAFILTSYFIRFRTVRLYPDKFVHSVNYVKANNIVTPKHIVPE